MKKEDIFAPFYIEKIAKEPLETIKNTMPIFSLLFLLLFSLVLVKAVFDIPRSGLPWQVSFLLTLSMLAMCMLLLPALYWDKDTGEYRGKRFRTALVESTFLLWFWLLMSVPAGIVNFMKLLIMLLKVIYGGLKKSQMGQSIKNSVITPCTIFFQRPRKESIPFILKKFVEKIKRIVKAPFLCVRKFWKLWKENPILNGNEK